MIVRPGEIRRLLRAKGAPQVSEDAVVAMAAGLERLADSFADESLRVLQERNASRDVQRLEVLRRLTAEHVEEALRRSHGNG